MRGLSISSRTKVCVLVFVPGRWKRVVVERNRICREDSTEDTARWEIIYGEVTRRTQKGMAS